MSQPRRYSFGFVEGRSFAERVAHFAEDAGIDRGSAARVLAGEELDEQARAYIHDHPETDYRTALHAAMERAPALKAAYVQPPGWRYASR